jgi:hypothetical protein
MQFNCCISNKSTGAEVGVVEKFKEFQGNYALNTGSRAGTRFEREAKLGACSEDSIEDLLKKSNPHEAGDFAGLGAHESDRLKR